MEIQKKLPRPISIFLKTNHVLFFDKAYKIEKNQAETLIEENNKSCKREKYEEF